MCFLHQNDSVTEKPLPADPADVQRLKGKLQSVPKPADSAATVATPVAPASSSGASSGATVSTTPVSVLQVSMLRVDGKKLEPEPEPIRRHPVANPTAHHNRWLWANLLQEEYPSQGCFMNTMGSRTGLVLGSDPRSP